MNNFEPPIAPDIPDIPEILSRVPVICSQDRFMQIVTNPEALDEEMRSKIRKLNGPISLVRSYLLSILQGDGQKAFCPFVSRIESSNAYHLKLFPARPEVVDFDVATTDLMTKFSSLSPRVTSPDSPTDLTTVIGAFSHRDAASKDFCDRLVLAHQDARHKFLEKGLMIAHMHPFHEPASVNPNAPEASRIKHFLSALPIFIVRRMQRRDGVFLKDDQSQSTFRSFFPDV